ncbi:hypothetical protein GCM10010468_35670 [Actinocorallia longicatena]|uniref:Uncharacterized protein n=2 Tax=Actinocorallia longicatena TaxID=111803 RepID=A0ABP6QB10_9ACTN
MQNLLEWLNRKIFNPVKQTADVTLTLLMAFMLASMIPTIVFTVAIGSGLEFSSGFAATFFAATSLTGAISILLGIYVFEKKWTTSGQALASAVKEYIAGIPGEAGGKLVAVGGSPSAIAIAVGLISTIGLSRDRPEERAAVALSKGLEQLFLRLGPPPGEHGNGSHFPRKTKSDE